MSWNNIQLNLNTREIKISEKELITFKKNKVDNEKNQVQHMLYLNTYNTVLQYLKTGSRYLEPSSNHNDILFNAYWDGLIDLTHNGDRVYYLINTTHNISNLLNREKAGSIFLSMLELPDYKTELSRLDMISPLELRSLLEKLDLTEYLFTQLNIQVLNKISINEFNIYKNLNIEGRDFLSIFPKLAYAILLTIQQAKLEKTGIMKKVCSTFNLDYTSNLNEGNLFNYVLFNYFKNLAFNQSVNLITKIYDVFDIKNVFTISFSYQGIILSTTKENITLENYLNNERMTYKKI